MEYTYDYPRAAIGCSIILWRFNERLQIEVLLIKRKDEPYKNHLALPGGFMNMDETLLQCAKREAKEEVNLDDSVHLLEQFVMDEIDRDPRCRMLDAIHSCIVPMTDEQCATLKEGDDAKDLQWINLGDVLYEGYDNNKTYFDLAFDHKNALERWFGKNFETDMWNRLLYGNPA
jgi:8-oxo-dGTP diphosphatase